MTVDMLLNNAGFGSHDLFVDEDPDNVAREIQLNCGSLVALPHGCCRAWLPAAAAEC
jgi:hypothetical protein